MSLVFFNSGSSTPVQPPPQTHFPPNWKQRVLWGVNAARWQDPEVLRLLDAWAKVEGGTAQWNPLNTTMPLGNWTNYNNTGVKNYAKNAEGICATVLTLVNGNYNGILGSLQGGSLTAPQIVGKYRQQFQTWGTDPDLLLQILAQ